MDDDLVYGWMEKGLDGWTDDIKNLLVGLIGRWMNERMDGWVVEEQTTDSWVGLNMSEPCNLMELLVAVSP